MTSLPALLAEARTFASTFQIERFVIAMNGVTLWGAFQQCLRELRTRWDALTSDYFEIEKAKLDLEEEESHFYDDVNLTIEQKKHKLEAMRLRCRIEAVEHVAKDRAREFGHYLALARAYRSQFGKAPLTQEKRDSYDADLWEETIKAMVALELLSGAPNLSPAIQQQINALPVDMRARVRATFTGKDMQEQGMNQRTLIGRWMSHSVTVPEVEDVPVDEVRRLVCRSQFPQVLPDS